MISEEYGLVFSFVALYDIQISNQEISMMRDNIFIIVD
jgi:hypothetical protein